MAASLCKRGIEVHVVGPEKVPMARVLGEPAGKFIQQLHESQGVKFHLGNSVKQVKGRQIALSDGGILDADFPHLACSPQVILRAGPIGIPASASGSNTG